MRRRILISAALLIAGLLALAAWIRLGPLPPGFLDTRRRASTVVVDRHGQVLYETISATSERSQWLSANELPPLLVRATLAAEDRRFFHHPGVDPIAVARAAIRDVRARQFVEGGSTISQQVVKLLTRTHQRSLKAKAREAILAVRLEHHLRKEEILALYLNLAPYGNQMIGVSRASRAYFGCAPKQLTPAQAAFLAALPQRPTGFNPYRNESAARARQLAIVDRLERDGWITRSEAKYAREERLVFKGDSRPFLAPHFVGRVLEQFGDAGVERIETTIDAGLQRDVRGIIESRRASLRKHGASNVAVAVLDNRSGEWLAWEGSGDFEGPGGAIDGVTTPRQPGSALKPFTYALAFERGFTPASILPDIPSHFPTAEAGILYSPRNYDGVYRGPLRARSALAGSENVPAVALLSRVGVSDLLRFLRRAGFSSFDKTADYYGLGLTLGDAEVRLDEMVEGYAAFARGGESIEPVAVTSIRTSDGIRRVIDRRAGTRLLSQRSAFWISDILSDPGAREYVFGSGGNLDFPFQVAVKTGTSQAYHDNWTIGFTRDVTVGVWVGNFDRTPLRNSSGITGAAPIFHQVMLAAEKRIRGRLPSPLDPPIVEPTPDTSRQPVCVLSGLRATPACPSVESEWLPSSSPLDSCSWHVRSAQETLVRWPAEYRSWARERGLVRTISLPPPRRNSRTRVTKSVRIVNPPPGAIYLVDPTLRREFQAIPLRAECERSDLTLTWEIDGRSVGSSQADTALHWPLRVGRHRVRVRDAAGSTDETMIFVK